MPIPIILCCGIARFDAVRETLARLLRPAGLKFPDSGHYFRGIKSHLESHGHLVFHSKVSFAAGVRVRARNLADQVTGVLNEAGAERAHLIAHSMGGLDARYMIARIDGMAAKVKSLTTIGTPHFGSPVADRILESGLAGWVSGLSKIVDLKGAHDLTTIACKRFNEEVEAIEAENEVAYFSWSSCSSEVFRPLQKSARIIQQVEGENDGLVSVASQRWKPALTGPGGKKHVRQYELPFPADHLNQLGWWGPSDVKTPLRSLSAISEWKRKYREAAENAKKLYLSMAGELPD